MDLYSGKGTSVLESCLLGRLGIGNDICPDAYVLTFAKSRLPKKVGLLRYLIAMKKRFRPENIDKIPENVKTYFSKHTLAQISSMRTLLKKDLEKGIKKNDETLIVNSMFVTALILGILHGSTQYSLSLPVPHSFAMSPNYVKKKFAEDPVRYAKPDRNIINCLLNKIELVFTDPIPHSFCPGDSYNEDAAQFSLDEPVDLIITSPPYFDVHTYAWDNWLRLWFLGYEYRDVRKLLIQTGSERVYLKHMEKSLRNMFNLLKENSRCFIIVGDVKGHVPTANLLASLIENSSDLGFSISRVIVDSIRPTSRYLFGRNSHVGVKTDRILELHKGKPVPCRKEVPWNYDQKPYEITRSTSHICTHFGFGKCE